MEWLTQLLSGAGGAGSTALTPAPGTAQALYQGTGEDWNGQVAAPGAPAGGGFNSNNFLAGLRGVQAPKPPDVVKPTTPAAPQTKPIAGGELFALLNALSAPRTQTQMPVRLGQTLGTGRY